MGVHAPAELVAGGSDSGRLPNSTSISPEEAQPAFCANPRAGSPGIGGARLLPSGARVVAVFRTGYVLWDRFDEAGISIARQNLQHAHEARLAGIGVLRALSRVRPLGYTR